MDLPDLGLAAGAYRLSALDCGKFSPDHGSPECTKNDNAFIGVVVVVAVVLMLAFAVWFWWARRRLSRSANGARDAVDDDAA